MIRLSGSVEHVAGAPSARWCLRLARRSGRPLAVVRVVADPPPGPREAAALLRCTDVVAPAPGGRHLDLVCPDTDAAGAAALAGRLRAALAVAGREVRCGTATFPEDGFTLEDLFGIAAARARVVASGNGPLRPAAGDRPGLREAK